MDLIKELNMAIDYIEKNMTDEDALLQVSKVTSYSSYHFKRIFNYIAGIPLSEYIRRRKLSLAVNDLQVGEKVIDVAEKYGYNSPDSFTRAFTRQHGVTPNLIRQGGINYDIYPPLAFQLKVAGGEKMTCRIEKKESFNLFGVYEELMDDHSARNQVIDFHRKCEDHRIRCDINTFLGYHPDTMLHVARYDYDRARFKYMKCQYLPDGIYVPEQYTRVYVPANQWAIFSVEESDEVETMWQRIYSEWLPYTQYESAKDISFEIYYDNFKTAKARAEIWIPVKDKVVYHKNDQRYSNYLGKERNKRMSKNYRVQEFVYDEKLNDSLYKFWCRINEKYPNGIYWSVDPRSNEGKNVFLLWNKEKQLIGKGHAMIFEKQGDDAPGYAEHRIFIHYRVLPEYETDEEAVDILYNAVYERALELRKTLSNRVCQLCIGNHNFEEFYNNHVAKKDWKEHGNIYHFAVSTKSYKEQLEPYIEGIAYREISLDNQDIVRMLHANDQVCFRETVSSYEFFKEIHDTGSYIAYAAFYGDKIIGSVIAVRNNDYPPEIESVMVLPEYRGKHIATKLIKYVLNVFYEEGRDTVILVTTVDNEAGIKTYKSLGFEVYSHEKRYMRYI